MTNKKYEHSLVVVDGQSVQFSDLPHMVAIAMHPDGEMAYGAARLNLENELTQAVSDGLLTVRNRYGLGIHTFPHGDALQQAVLMPDELRPFLNARGIELRITLHGNGPGYQTLENTAAAMQEQIQPLTTPEVNEQALSGSNERLSVTHSKKMRRDSLTPVIELAQTKCRNPLDAAEVWTSLMVLANDEQGPLLGMRGKNIGYMTGDENKEFTRKALGARLARKGSLRPAKAC